MDDGLRRRDMDNTNDEIADHSVTPNIIAAMRSR